MSMIKSSSELCERRGSWAATYRGGVGALSYFKHQSIIDCMMHCLTSHCLIYHIETANAHTKSKILSIQRSQLENFPNQKTLNDKQNNSTKASSSCKRDSIKTIVCELILIAVMPSPIRVVVNKPHDFVRWRAQMTINPNSLLLHHYCLTVKHLSSKPEIIFVRWNL